MLYLVYKQERNVMRNGKNYQGSEWGNQGSLSGRCGWTSDQLWWRGVGSNEIALPVVDEDGNEKWLVLTFKVPTGSRDGDAYDGYSMAEDYQMKQAEKKAKAEAKVKETAKNKAKAEAKKKEKGA